MRLMKARDHRHLRMERAPVDNGTGEPPPRHHHQRMADKLVLGSDAIARGECNWKQLGRKFQPIYRNVYLPLGVELTAETKAHAAWLSTGATLAGLSAAAIYRTKWIDADRPAEIVRPDRHHQPGMISHSWTLNDGEIWVRNGMRVTTPVRTAFDVGRCQRGDDAIVLLDALLSATRLGPATVADFAATKRGQRGVRRLLAALELVDAGAESPQETKVRLVLVRGGFPPLQTQLPDLGYRLDMGWRKWKVAVEYDGRHHFADARQIE